MSPWFRKRAPVAKAPGLGQGDKEHDSVLGLYNEFERKLRIQIEAVLSGAVADQTISEIVEAFQSGVVARVEAAVNFATIGAALGTEMGPILLEAMRRGGEQALRQLPGELVGGFNVTDPLAVSFIRTSAATSVVQITQETEAALRLIIQRAYAQGLGSRAAAREIKSVIGLTRRQAVSVSNFRRSLISAIETDAGPAAIISDFKLSRNVVTARNMRLANVDRLTTRYQSRWIEHRSTLIARNEAVSAVSAGRRALWEQAVQAGAIDPAVMRKIWQTTPDARACPICLPLHGQAVPINEDFVSKDVGNLAGPPAHIACFPGDTKIQARGAIIAATKRWTDLGLIRIDCGSTLRPPLRCTPNHPIWTPDGWCAARDIIVGQEIAHPGFDEGIPRYRIEDEVKAMGWGYRERYWHEVGTTHEDDFHGDGWEHTLAFVVRQKDVKRMPRQPGRIRPVDMQFREVRSIDGEPFSGYVYNIETTEGYYLAEGTVVQNCRCNTIIAPDPARGGRPSEPQRRTDRRIEDLREESAPALEAAARTRGEEV